MYASLVRLYLKNYWTDFDEIVVFTLAIKISIEFFNTFRQRCDLG
jgi:hypothetical protein